MRLTSFDHGVTDENLDAFLDGADLFVDGFDFFAVDIRRRTFARCRELGIPALTAAPLGMGVGLLVFMPTGMSFEEYFRLDGHSTDEQYLRFLIGLAPKGLHRSYLADPSRVSLADRRGPSTGAACLLCSGAVAAMATRILLLRDGVKAAPIHHQYDAYRQQFATSRLSRGNNGPLQRIKIAIARRQLRAMLLTAPGASPPATPLEAILDAARWTPSGDNVQPWRFTIVGPDRVRVSFDPHDVPNPYEYRQGEPARLSAGMMLEALRIAASVHGRAMHWELNETTGQPIVEAEFPITAGIEPDPLYAVLALRSVNRMAYRRRPLLPRERLALEASLGPALSIRWHEGDRARLAFGRVGGMATRLRLRLPEAYGRSSRRGRLVAR